MYKHWAKALIAGMAAIGSFALIGSASALANGSAVERPAPAQMPTLTPPTAECVDGLVVINLPPDTAEVTYAIISGVQGDGVGWISALVVAFSLPDIVELQGWSLGSPEFPRPDCSPPETPPTDPPFVPTYDLEAVCTSVDQETGKGSAYVTNHANQGVTVGGVPLAPGESSENGIEATGNPAVLPVQWEDGRVGEIEVDGNCTYTPPNPNPPSPSTPGTSTPGNSGGSNGNGSGGGPGSGNGSNGNSGGNGGSTPGTTVPDPASSDWELPETR